MLITKCIIETDLRKKADKPTKEMLDIWQRLCIKEIGKPVEVLVINRRDFPATVNAVYNTLNTNRLLNSEGKPVLGLFLENTLKLNYIILTHELGHRIVGLQGIKAVINRKKVGEKIEMALNNLCSHSSLYKLQRSVGHNPQNEIDRIVNCDIVGVSKIIETDNSLTQIEDALYFSDNLINCSENCRKGLQRVLTKRLPKTQKLVNSILEIKGSKDISITENANWLLYEALKFLNLENNWSVEDGIFTLKNFIVELGYKSP